MGREAALLRAAQKQGGPGGKMAVDLPQGREHSVIESLGLAERLSQLEQGGRRVSRARSWRSCAFTRAVNCPVTKATTKLHAEKAGRPRKRSIRKV